MIVYVKRFRFDVFKFSLNGLDKANKQEARAALAIRLGAKVYLFSFDF